jgi:lysyl-tRNA synthetase, class II
MAINNIKKARLEKLKAIKKAGHNPYPIESKRTHVIEGTLSEFKALCRSKTKLFLVGRIMSVREHGGSTFINIEDATGRIQGYLKEDKLGEKQYRFFLDNFDIGDIAELGGILFETKRGEKTLEVSDFKILAKSLLPLPEKWHGLKDVEERFRKRYLDLIMNPEAKEKFVMRSRIVEELRNIFSENNFMELETPVLQPIPGGALAKPFKTHLNALDMDLYLRVAPELYLKRLLVGGFEKIYEIGRCFRNEGIDKHHNPDFTMLELYWAYQDRDGLMDFVERFFDELLKRTGKGLSFSYQGQKIDFKRPWKKITFRDLVKKYADFDIETASDEDFKKKAKELKIDIGKDFQKCKMMDEIYKVACRPKLINPTFVTDHPAQMAILSKPKENDSEKADRFQLVVGGIEMVNGFSELNDPLEQEERFKKSKMEEERTDRDFLEALQYGMPPAAGLGVGIDRLVALLTDSHSLREAILFPTMRPKQ